MKKINIENERKLLEVLSFMSGIDFTENFQASLKVTAKGKVRVYLSRKGNFVENVEVTSIYEQMLEILEFGDIPSSNLEKFINESRTVTTKKLKSRFGKESKFVIKGNIQKEKDKAINELIKVLILEKEKEKRKDNSENLIILEEIEEIGKLKNKKKINDFFLDRLILFFPFLKILRKSFFNDAKIATKMVDCKHKNTILEREYHEKISGEKYIANLRCPDCKTSLIINPNLSEVRLKNNSDFLEKLSKYRSDIEKTLNLLKNPNIDYVFDIFNFLVSKDKEYKKRYKQLKDKYVDAYNYRGYSGTNYALSEEYGAFNIISEKDEMFFYYYGEKFSLKDWINNEIIIKKRLEDAIGRKLEDLKNETNKAYEEAENILFKEESMTTFVAIKKHSGYGKGTYAKLLKGSKDKKLKKYNLANSKYYGKLSKLKIAEIEGLIFNLEDFGLVVTEYVGRHKLPILETTQKGENIYAKVQSKIKSGKITKDLEKIYSDISLTEAFKSLNQQRLEECISLFDTEKLEEEAIFLELVDCFFQYRKEYLPFIDKMIELMAKIPDKYIPILELHFAMSDGVQKTTLRDILKLKEVL